MSEPARAWSFGDEALKLVAHLLGTTTVLVVEALDMLHNHSKQRPAYKTFRIPKKSGGFRIIRTPLEPLKGLMRKILSEVLACYPVSYHAMGFRPRRSIFDNAKRHLDAGAMYMLNMDIKDFFPSIPVARIRLVFDDVVGKALRANGADGFVIEDVIEIFSRLCTLRYGSADTAILPMGTPTSPALSNLVMTPFDHRLNAQLRKLGAKYGTTFTYTRYGDDICISSPDPLPRRELFGLVKSLLKQFGFSPNEKKTRNLRRNGSGPPMEVTGLILGEDHLLLPDEKLQTYAYKIMAVLIEARPSDSELSYMRGALGLIRMIYGLNLTPRIHSAIQRAVREVGEEQVIRRLPRKLRSIFGEKQEVDSSERELDWVPSDEDAPESDEEYLASLDKIIQVELFQCEIGNESDYLPVENEEIFIEPEGEPVLETEDTQVEEIVEPEKLPKRKKKAKKDYCSLLNLDKPGQLQFWFSAEFRNTPKAKKPTA